MLLDRVPLQIKPVDNSVSSFAKSTSTLVATNVIPNVTLVPTTNQEVRRYHGDDGEGKDAGNEFYTSVSEGIQGRRSQSPLPYSCWDQNVEVAAVLVSEGLDPLRLV